MRRLGILFFTTILLAACKNNTEAEATNANAKEASTETSATSNDDLRTMVGQFIYYGDAAVLQTNNNIYGVVINDKMHELNAMAKPYKDADTDYVTVQLKGKLIPKTEGEEGWPFKIDIKTIDNVKKYEAKENEVIKLGNAKTQ